MNKKSNIPPEAAAIMARMVRMPPKPHEDMKVGKATVATQTEKDVPILQPAQVTSKKAAKRGSHTVS